jgi:hypothetical protein
VTSACIAVLLGGCHRTAPQRDTSEPLFLNAAPQDHALYLTWNTAHTGGEVTVHCRRAAGGAWSSVEAGSRRYAFFDGLENNLDYECFATRRDGRATISSRPITQTPRARPPRVGTSYFTNQRDADQWLRSRHIAPQSLFLRGQPVAAWDAQAPDGVYTDARGELLFILLRHAGNGFRAPTAPRPPGEVRTVLKHALWPKDNPFDQPEQFAMPVTPIEPPIAGQVTHYAAAASFSVAFHAQLSSRCTNFVPEKPTPGRIAIHVYGHDLFRRSESAATIDALLDRGWQVIAVDMPLLGANGADQSDRLRDHNSFLRWNTDGISPVALFLQPLKAIVDQIYRDNGSNPDLTVMLVGRSGGGWTSFMYAALDERIHYAVSVADGMPMSHWGRDKPLRTADYEQLDPLIYESVGYEDIMPVAGSRGAFYVYNEHDPCCFRLSPDDAFLRYLQSAALALHKPIGVYVDRETTTHSFSAAAVDAMDTFIAATDATKGIPAPTATPTGDDGGS